MPAVPGGTISMSVLCSVVDSGVLLWEARSRINRIRRSLATVAFVSCRVGGMNPFGRTERLHNGQREERV